MVKSKKKSPSPKLDQSQINLQKKHKTLTKKVEEVCKVILERESSKTAPFCKILPGSWLCDCPLCGKKDGVGVIVNEYIASGNKEIASDVVGVPTCFGGLICKECEGSLSKRGVRNTIPRKDSPEEAKHKREYKKFLEGKLYPEIKCTHTVGRWDAYSDQERRYVKGENEGQVMVCNARLKTNSIYKGA